MMYSASDYMEITRRIRRKELILGSVLIPLLAILIAALIRRIKWLAMISAVMLFVAACFGFSALLIPDLRYRSFLKDIDSRLRQEICGTLLSVSKQAELQDGAMVFPVHIRLKENEDDRIVYLNASKAEGFPPLGADVKLECSGRHIYAVVNP